MAGTPPQFKKAVIARRLKQNKGQAAAPGKSASPAKGSGKGLPPWLVKTAAQGAANGDPLSSGHASAIQRRFNSKPKPKPNPSAPVGQGGRFAAMLAQGVPPGAAANAGRKKYGKKPFQQMAARGRS